MTNTALYFITGSSGSGKTTLLRSVIQSTYPNLSAYHFDDLGIPSREEMTTKFGGPAQWQAHMVHKWIKKVAQVKDAGLVVLDGQARPTVIRDAAKKAGFSALHITLIDCSHEERRRRLIDERTQPELDTLDMYAWAAYLRGQADALGLEIIDTTHLHLAEAVQQLARSIEHFAEETGIHLERSSETKLNRQS
jgi:GTPase SAR1 family protein